MEIKDYNIVVTVRNNCLLTKMREAGFYTASELSRETGISKSEIYRCINLTVSGQRQDGNWRLNVCRLAKFFRCLPEDLYPPQHAAAPLPKRRAEFDVSLEDIDWFLSGTKQLALPPDERMEKKDVEDAINKVLNSLTPREQTVLCMRFGLDGEGERKFHQIGDHLGVGVERVRQIEAKALRKLKHPARMMLLNNARGTMNEKQFADSYPDGGKERLLSVDPYPTTWVDREGRSE